MPTASMYTTGLYGKRIKNIAREINERCAQERRNHTHSPSTRTTSPFLLVPYTSRVRVRLYVTNNENIKKLTEILNFLILIFLDLEQGQRIAWRDKGGEGFPYHRVYAPSGSFAFHKINRDFKIQRCGSNENIA